MFVWIKTVQIQHCGAAIVDVKKNTYNSQFARRVRPFLDIDDLLKFGGRFQLAPLSTSAIHPIILPKATHDAFTKLLILYIHQALHHTGTMTTLATVQRKYWLPQIRRQIHHTLLRCIVCARDNAKPYTQPVISVLPEFRMEHNTTPFKNMGIDVCGPFLVLNQKVWILLSTCLVMRGTALEVIESMETHQLYDALRRIAARRSWPEFLLSDNAPQFQLLKAHIDKNSIKQLTWKFIPAYSPWQGGVYERLNAIVKASLYRSLRELGKIGPTQFRTLITEIEFCVNSRPLVDISSDADIKVLTPNDLLGVKGLDLDIGAEPASDTKAAKTLAAMSRNAMEISHNFWSEWRTTYLNHIRERPSTQAFQRTSSKCDPKIGDVVIIKDPIRKRAQWKLARITELVTSSDNEVRAARVRNGTGNLTTHPLKDLYLLEINPQLPLPTPQEEDVEILGPDDLEAEK